MSFQLSSELDQTKFFLISQSDIEARLDVEYYQPYHYQDLQRLENSPYSLKKLDYICTRIVDGPFGSVIKANDYVEHGIPFIRVADVTHGEGTIKTNKLIFISEEAHEKIKRSKVVPNDVVIAKTGATMGAASVIPEAIVEANIRGDLGALTVKKELCTPQYVIAFINTAIGQRLFWRLDSGGTRGRVVIGNLKKYPVIIPPREIQEEIVLTMKSGYSTKKQKEAEAQKLLDSIDDYLLAELGIELPEQEENTVQNRIFIRKLSELSGRRFDAFYYKDYFKLFFKGLKNSRYIIKQLKEVSTFQAGYAFSSNDYLDQSKCFLVTIKNISKNEIDLSRTTFLPDEFYEKYKDFQIKKGSLLIAMTGATIGKVGIYNNNNEALLNQRNGIIKVSEQLNVYYLMNLLNTNVFQNIIIRNSNGGAQPNISETDIRRIKIPLPPIEKQTEIANHITEIRNQAKQLQHLAKIELEQVKKQVEAMILGEA